MVRARVTHWFAHDIVDRGRLPLLCCLVAFILTFFVTRTFVRFIRHRADTGLPAQVVAAAQRPHRGVHIHHVAFGVVLVMISGLTLGDPVRRRAANPNSPWPQSFSVSGRRWCSTSTR